MGLDTFNWKSLFVNEEGAANKKTEQVPPALPQNNNSFPTSNASFPTQTVNVVNTNASTNNNSNNPFLNEVLAVYEKGFDSLNQSGFDFFELYKSVQSVGATNRLY